MCPTLGLHPNPYLGALSSLGKFSPAKEDRTNLVNLNETQVQLSRAFPGRVYKCFAKATYPYARLLKPLCAKWGETSIKGGMCY